MSKPLARPTVASAQSQVRKRILSVVDRLVNQPEPLDIATIDSTFFWECLNFDDFQAVESLRSYHPFYLPTGQDGLRVDDILAHLWDRNNLPAETIERYLTHGGLLPILAPEVATIILPIGDRAETRLEVTVPDRSWTGKEVAALVAAWIDSHANEYRLLTEDSRTADPWLISVESPKGTMSFRMTVGLTTRAPQPHSAPCIAITIGIPVPPSSLIAAGVDAALTQFPDWMPTQSRRSGSRTESITVIRTWSILLLMRLGGLRYMDASDRIRESGIDEVSQQQYMAQRNDLYRRVPELRARLKGITAW